MLHHTQPHIRTQIHMAGALPSQESRFKESMQGKCYKIYSCKHSDILGGKMIRRFHYKVQQNHTGENGQLAQDWQWNNSK